MSGSRVQASSCMCLGQDCRWIRESRFWHASDGSCFATGLSGYWVAADVWVETVGGWPEIEL